MECTTHSSGNDEHDPQDAAGPPRTFWVCVFLVSLTALVMAKQGHVGYRALGRIPHEGPLQGEWRKWRIPTEAEWVVRNIESARGKDPHSLEEVEEYADVGRWTARLAGRQLTSEEWQRMRDDIARKRRYNRYWHFSTGWGATLLLLVPVTLIWSLVISVLSVLKKRVAWAYRLGAFAMLTLSIANLVIHRYMNIPHIF